ncbi:hypothetical protein ABIF97_004181 [Bradyrhizobium japonicum]
MAKVPRFAKAFAGCWRIVEMDNWDSDFLDLVEEVHLTFGGKSDGEIAFGALEGFLDVRYGARDGSPCAEFSWEGYDDNDHVCGHGWVMIGTADRLVGHFYIHNGDDSGFVCERGLVLQQPARASTDHVAAYPAAMKYLRHSVGVKRPIALQSPATVRSAAWRKSALSLAKAFSIGLESGL